MFDGESRNGNSSFDYVSVYEMTGSFITNQTSPLGALEIWENKIIRVTIRRKIMEEMY